MWSKLTESGSLERSLEIVFRLGVAGCFIGHGAFGVIGKSGWLPYFAVAGIGEDLAWQLMPIVGTMDILIGIAALVSPRPALLAYAAGWALWTALLRPLAGESFFETLERAGNYGIPLAFLALASLKAGSWRQWLRPVAIESLTAEGRDRVALVLRGTIALLLLGHGGLALSGKPLLAEHLASLGLPAGSLAAFGAVEVAMAVLVAIRPFPGLLLLILFWKLGTEALYPVTGAPFWEFVERAGSYAAPFALWVMVRKPVAVGVKSRATEAARAGAAALVLATGGTLLWTATAAAGNSRGALPAPTEGTVAPSSVPLAGPTPSPLQSALLAKLRGGTLVLACRHAITDRSRGDRRPVDLSDPSTQRVLSGEGREQARQLGSIMRRLDVPVGEVLTSPYSRTEESAELAFGRSTRTRALMYGNSREQRQERKRLLSTPTDGGNRVLMTHQGILYSNLPGFGRGSIAEGECVAVEPQGGGRYDVLEKLGLDEWKALR